MTYNCSSSTPSEHTRTVRAAWIFGHVYTELRHFMLYGCLITPAIVREHHQRARAARDAAAIRQWRRGR